MDDVQFTVLIDCRDNADLLAPCLAHLEQQHFPSAQMEILILDYGSVDDSLSIVEEYAAGSPIRIKTLGFPREQNVAAARNAALDAATGQYLLFFDVRLLASPHLVQRHAAQQRQHDPPIALIGAIDCHPQSGPGLTLGWPDVSRTNGPAPLGVLDWHLANTSLPRRTVLDAGGFDVAFPVTAFSDLELAYRLTQSGFEGYFCRDAVAYVWRSLAFSKIRELQYLKGYSLRLLEQKTDAAAVRQHFPTARPPLMERLHAVLSASTRTASDESADSWKDSRLARRALRSAFAAGYAAASAGKLLRPQF